MNSHRCRMRTSSGTAAGERRWSAGATAKSPATRKRKARRLFAAALWLGVVTFCDLTHHLRIVGVDTIRTKLLHVTDEIWQQPEKLLKSKGLISTNSLTN